MFSSRKTAAPSSGGYNLTKSLRFRSSASAYLNRTPTVASNRQTWTWSGWVKRGAISSATMGIFGVDGLTSYMFIMFNNSGSNNELDCGELATTQQWRRTTTQVFRDPSAWYHIVFAFDSTQATAGNRIKIYVNGTQVTSFSTSVDPPLNYSSIVNTATAHSIGRVALPTGYYLDGYFTEVNFIDGQQLTPSSFGSTNSTTGVWQPARYTGTYGPNGFYLPFTNITSTSTLGNDSSGNGNNWTTNNISLTTGSTYDSMYDVPTLTSATVANYAVINPLIYRYTAGNSTFSNGNLTITGLNTGNSHFQLASIAIPSSSNKFYWENTLGTTSSGAYAGITQFSNFQSGNWDAWYDTINGVVYKGASSFASVATAASGDIVGIAYDSTANTCAFYKNNTLLTTVTGITAAEQVPLMCTRQASVLNLNFGQQPFTYTPPTGYVALNTYNL